MNTVRINTQVLLEEFAFLRIDLQVFSASLEPFIQQGNEILARLIDKTHHIEACKLECIDLENQVILFLKDSFREDSTRRFLATYQQRASLIETFSHSIVLEQNSTNSYVINCEIIVNGLTNNLLMLNLFNQVAQQQIAKKELQSCSDFLEETQRIARIGIYSIDIASGNWTASKVLEDIMGIDSNYPKTFQGGYDLLHPEWREKMNHYFVNEVIGQHAKFDITYKIIRPIDNEERWIHGLGDLKYNDQGEPIKLNSIIQDVTVQRKAEEEINKSSKRYRDLLENIDAGIVIHAMDTSIIDCNQKALTLLGLSQEQMFGKLAIDPEWKFLDEHQQPLSLNNYPVNLIKTTQLPLNSMIVGVKRPITKDVIWALVNGFPVLDVEGNIIEIVISFIDITEHRRLEFDIHERMAYEVELQAAKEKAEESEKLKTAFLQNMSHEIRTPLNAIIGFLQMLENPNLSPEKRKSFSSIIKNSSTQLLSIVGDILTISSLETKQVKLAISAVNMNSVLVDLLTIFKQQAADQNLMLYLKQNLSDHFAEIYTDRVKIIQVLTNLLTNALKFTQQGSIEFGYTLQDDMLVFFVKDTGTGISANQQEIIFERFQQANLTINEKYGGTGLGLSISKGFVELMEGKIWVESELDHGATFFFSIPYRAVHSNEANTNEASQIDKKNTVLIAEDIEINFLLLEEIFNDLGCTTIHAKNGREAVDICLHNPAIDIVLMDIKMPVMDGFSAAKLIREARPDLPIIAQTGYAYDDEKEKYKEMFNDYITKPFDLEDMINLFKKYIQLI